MTFARAGVTSIEYVSVCAMICLVIVSAVGVLGESLGGVDRVSRAFTSNETQDGVTTAKVANSIYELVAENRQSSSEVSHLQLFSVLSSLCLVGLGILYIRKSMAKPPATDAATCDVAQIQMQSKALRSVLNKRNRVRSTLMQDWVHLFEDKGVVGSYMSRDVASVNLDMPIEEADLSLRKDGFRRVMVTYEDGRMAGVLSRKDIAGKKGKYVRDIMTSEPKTAAPDMSLRIALSILLQHRISCLPVVYNGKLVGLLSTSDLLIVFQCMLLILSSQKESTANAGEERN